MFWSANAIELAVVQKQEESESQLLLNGSMLFQESIFTPSKLLIRDFTLPDPKS